ncbi:MAG: tRNA (N6-threonylcarbamoyladenosine(37)-N6)-methyltransferase TrmO [Luteolibacter sp.]
MLIESIGEIRSCFGEKFAVPRQPGICPSAWGRLVFHEKYRSPEAIRGIEGFSHLWLVFGFHQTLAQGWKPTVRPPRLGGNQRVGVFASRSTFRPNGLGLSLVRLEGVENGGLLLGGLDLVDGTPVYDVKPYLAYAESVPDARSGFADEEIPRMEVMIDPAVAAKFQKLPARAQAVICEALSLDPRPATHSDDSERLFGVVMCGCNVKFSIREGMCRVMEIHAVAGSGLNG